MSVTSTKDLQCIRRPCFIFSEKGEICTGRKGEVNPNVILNKALNYPVTSICSVQLQLQSQWCDSAARGMAKFS